MTTLLASGAVRVRPAVALHPLVILLLVVLLLSACTTTSGTRLSASQGDLAKIKKLGTVVKSEEGFSVRQAREKMTGTGIFLASVVGLAIEAGLRSASDSKEEETLKPVIGNFDPTRLLAEHLTNALRAQPEFRTADTATTSDPSVLRREGFDALLEVTVKEWGLRVCSTSDDTENVQAGFSVHGRLLHLDIGSPIWERSEVYLDGECHPVEAFRSRDGLLRTALSRAAERLARRIVNDLMFP